MGRDITLEKALYKGLIASGMKIPTHGSVLFTIADKDKEEAMSLTPSFPPNWIQPTSNGWNGETYKGSRYSGSGSQQNWRGKTSSA